MSAPARACETAVAARRAIAASLSTLPSARTGPQWPWSVYSQRQVSAISTRSGFASRRRRSVSWTMPSSIQAPEPSASFDAGRPNRITPPMPSVGVAGDVGGRLVRRDAVHAGERRDRAPDAAPGLDEDRRHELARMDPRLADEGPEGGRAAGPAKAMGGIDGRRGRPVEVESGRGGVDEHVHAGSSWRRSGARRVGAGSVAGGGRIGGRRAGRRGQGRPDEAGERRGVRGRGDEDELEAGVAGRGRGRLADAARHRPPGELEVGPAEERDQAADRRAAGEDDGLGTARGEEGPEAFAGGLGALDGAVGDDRVHPGAAQLEGPDEPPVGDVRSRQEDRVAAADRQLRAEGRAVGGARDEGDVDAASLQGGRRGRSHGGPAGAREIDPLAGGGGEDRLDGVGAGDRDPARADRPEDRGIQVAAGLDRPDLDGRDGDRLEVLAR